MFPIRRSDTGRGFGLEERFQLNEGMRSKMDRMTQQEVNTLKILEHS